MTNPYTTFDNSSMEAYPFRSGRRGYVGEGRVVLRGVSRGVPLEATAVLVFVVLRTSDSRFRGKSSP